MDCGTLWYGMIWGYEGFVFMAADLERNKLSELISSNRVLLGQFIENEDPSSFPERPYSSNSCINVKLWR